MIELTMSDIDAIDGEPRVLDLTVAERLGFARPRAIRQPGYGAGRFPAEELRRAGQDELLVAGQAMVWQPRVGPAASVDTVLITETGPEPITPPTEWPFKRITVRGITSDVPDLLVRASE